MQDSGRKRQPPKLHQAAFFLKCIFSAVKGILRPKLFQRPFFEKVAPVGVARLSIIT